MITGGNMAQNKVQKNDLGTLDLSMPSEAAEIKRVAAMMAVRAMVNIRAT